MIYRAEWQLLRRGIFLSLIFVMKTNTIDTITEKILAGGRIGREEAEVLWREAPLSLLGRLASEMKRRKSGDAVYYNRNFHIEPTNICVFNCRFCSYRRGAGDPDAWNHSLAEFSFLGKLSQAFLAAVTPRTAGFNGVDMQQMLPATLLLTMVLMWIGGAPQSTAGGAKVTTFYLLVKMRHRHEVGRAFDIDLFFPVTGQFVTCVDGSHGAFPPLKRAIYGSIPLQSRIDFAPALHYNEIVKRRKKP